MTSLLSSKPSVPIAIGFAMVFSSCAVHTSPGMEVSRPRSCPIPQHWDGQICTARDSGVPVLARGIKSLAAFEVTEAIRYLTQATKLAPYTHFQYVRLHEQLGIAHAYLGNKRLARESFDMLLSLAPRHLLSYTLSPKVTFLFEQARRQLQQIPQIELRWPRVLKVFQPVPIELEVLADPKQFLKTATIYTRKKGDTRFHRFDISLHKPSTHQSIVLPSLESKRAETLQLYAIASDAQGNEVLSWASKENPREIPLAYHPPTRWYRKWWVWATIGGVVAAGTGAVVYGVTRSPSDTVSGSVTVSR